MLKLENIAIHGDIEEYDDSQTATILINNHYVAIVTLEGNKLYIDYIDEGAHEQEIEHIINNNEKRIISLFD